MEKKYWFKRRRYGYGWVPSTLEGVLVLVLFIGIEVSFALAFLTTSETVANKELGFFLVFTAILTAALLMICFKKGPSPKWRWGKRADDNPKEDF